MFQHLQKHKKKFVYAEEADVLNVALFEMTVKKWRERNPKLAENGNIRDYTDLLHLVILNNLQNTNAELIEEKMCIFFVYKWKIIFNLHDNYLNILNFAKIVI